MTDSEIGGTRMPIRAEGDQPLPSDSCRVTLFLTSDVNLYHASYVYAGLCELASLQKCLLDFEFEHRIETLDCGKKSAIVQMLVQHPAGRRRSICFDLNDRSDRIHEQLLQKHDIYFKRSYHSPDLAYLRPELRERVLPFGLCFGCRARRYFWPIVYASLSRASPRIGCSFVRSQLSRLRAGIQFCYYYSTWPVFAELEQSPETPLARTVFFQTRVWEDEGDCRYDSLNDERATLVRVLRREFGKRFCGGLIPTDYARKRYPDALCDGVTNRKAYIAASKRNLIGVYTEGLHHSFAWKLPEYLAASQCIVSQPLRNRLPEPLCEGIHLLQFDSASTCVEQCIRLLENPDMAAEMRRQNHRFYMSEAEPSVRMLRCLKQAFAL